MACLLACSRVKSLEEGIPLNPSRHLGVSHFHKLWRRVSIHRHRMSVGEFMEELIQSLANVHTMLDQALRTDIGLTDLALGLITAEKPVIAERFRVLLFRLPDAFGRLPFEPIQPPLANRHAGAYFQFAQCSSPLPGAWCRPRLVGLQFPAGTVLTLILDSGNLDALMASRYSRSHRAQGDGLRLPGRRPPRS